jgi:hypothetical protein
MLLVLCASYASSGAALVLGAYSAGRLLIAPALILAGWASLGHLVTLDDDAPGGWSNMGRARKVWLSSLAELSVKVALFAIAIMLFLAQHP